MKTVALPISRAIASSGELMRGLEGLCPDVPADQITLSVAKADVGSFLMSVAGR